jgi:putative DNA primase/helicase
MPGGLKLTASRGVIMSNAQRTADISEIENALARIPADDREVWVQVGMAIKSELGNAGFDIWDVWSQSAGNYNEQSARNTWRSFKDGRIRIGTLFYHARLNGWEKRLIQSPRRSTSTYALELWLKINKDDAVISKHPYAVAKGIESAGGAGRGSASGQIIGKHADCIIVPIRDIQTDKPVAMQCINPAGEKQTFGPVSGIGLLLGNTLNKSIRWYVCEGWASAYSMVFHHLKGNAVAAAAFGKSNMERLARAIADHYQPDEITILEEVDT